jgi:peptidoglycan-N-acetylglucosamine deacetylase
VSDAVARSPWPEGVKCAVSLAFDDGHPSQLRHAVPLLDAHKVAGSFYLTTKLFESYSPRLRKLMLERWAAAAASGHEIGNHTNAHPASANSAGVGEGERLALEELTLADIEREIDVAQRFLATELGCEASTFAYPCGMSFVGRGRKRESYVPLVAQRFVVGRSFHDECAASPLLCDLAHVPALKMDDQPPELLHALIDEAAANGTWLILVGHDVGNEAASPYRTQTAALESVLAYLDARRETIWVSTVSKIGAHLQARQAENVRRTEPPAP